MKVEQDIICTALPFTAGIGAGRLLFSSISDVSSAHFIAAMTATVLFIVLTLTAAGRKWPVAIIMLFACGVFCSFTDGLGSFVGGGGGGETFHLARTAAERAKEIIRGIPFEDSTVNEMLCALLVGDKSGLPKEITGIFRDSGASHILALSGFHLGIIYLIILKATSFFGNSPRTRTLRSLTVMSVCVFYTLAVGAAASITRACLFILLNETAKILNRSHSAVQVFCSALTLQLILTPSAIASVGFQLSYAAMAGIILIFPVLEKWYDSDRKDPLKKIWDACAISISCQLTTAPIAWHYFHTFPQYFLLTNLLALPVTTLLMIASLPTVILSAMGICPEIVVDINERTCRILLYILQVISSM